MLICPLDFELFSQKVGEKHGSKGFMKQMNAHETNFKQPQNEIILNPKPTPKNKGDRTRV
jgi:hypothetical protein